MKITAPRNSPKRLDLKSSNPNRSKPNVYPSPDFGMLTNINQVDVPQNSAYSMVNFWPKKRGVEPRGGLYERFTVGSPITYVFDYTLGGSLNKFFTTSTNVYEFTTSTPDATPLVPVLSGKNGGNYSHTQVETVGGSFIVLCNGVDNAVKYNGTSWSNINFIGGLSANAVSYVWNYNNRTFYVEKGTMNVWCTGVNSIDGAVVKIPLSSIFNNGGSILYGATISNDSGNNSGYYCVFVTTEGEVAMYSGDNPSDIDRWSLRGLYEVGRPLGQNAHYNVGGDLILGTVTGLIPMSAVMTKDESKLGLSSFLYNIEPNWLDVVGMVGDTYGWNLTKLVDANMVVLSPPSDAPTDTCFVVNTKTNAVGIFKGWSVGASAEMGSVLYIGTPSGKLCIGDRGGLDLGNPFNCQLCWNFGNLGSHVSKSPKILNLAFEYSANFSYVPQVKFNLNTEFIDPVFVAPIGDPDISEWDTSDWDTSDWSDPSTRKFSSYSHGVGGFGELVAPAVSILSGSVTKLNVRVMGAELLLDMSGNFRK